MTRIHTFSTWITESEQAPRPLRKIEDLDINRKFTRDPFTGDKYETELFPMFRRLKPRIEALPKKPTLEEFFELMQNSDNQFYSMVQADTLAQPDVRELWRDLTGRRASRMKKYNLTESLGEAAWHSELDPEWVVLIVWPDDENYRGYSRIFSQLGIAFADVSGKVIFIDGVAVENENLTKDHIISIEAHEIAHLVLEHRESARFESYDERQEQEADWFGIRLLDLMGYPKAAKILEKRFKDQYGIPSSKLEETDPIKDKLQAYIKNKR